MAEATGVDSKPEVDSTIGAPNPHLSPQVPQMASMDPVSNNQIPTFTGIATHITLSNWIDNVNQHKKLRNWTEEQTASAAKLRLEGKAAVWKENELAENPTAWDNWSDLQKALWDRFGEQKTPMRYRIACNKPSHMNSSKISTTDA